MQTDFLLNGKKKLRKIRLRKLYICLKQVSG